MNNKQVIKYVSENSKNPHAALMVEQLLTGWDVEVQVENGIWVKTIRTVWHPDVEHRLVKPKMKPAYRVYKHKDTSGTCAQDRYEDGTLSHHVDEDQIKIIQDWTEYDPEPKQWPTPLVERIAEIDIKAAEWIRDNWDELLEDRYTKKDLYYIANSRNSEVLGIMFHWEESPQGHAYWHSISIKLGE